MLDTFDSLVAGLPMLLDTDDGPSLEDLLTGASSPPPLLRTRPEAAEKMILGTSDLFLDSVPDLWMADGAADDSAGGCGNGGLLDGGGLQRSQQQQTHRTLVPAAAAEESRACSGAATPPAAAIAAPSEALGSHMLGGESNAAALSRGQGLRLQQQQAAGPAAGIAGGVAATACDLGAALDAASRMRIVSSSSQALFYSTASPVVCLDRSASSTASAGVAAPAAPAPPVTPAAAAIARLMSYTQPPPPAPAHAAGPVRIAAGSSHAALLLSPRAVAEMPARYDGCLSVPPATFSSTTGWNPRRPMPTPAEVLAAATAAAADGGGGLAPTRFDDCLFRRAAGAHCISDPVAMPSLRIASSAEVSALKANGAGFQHEYPGGGFGGGSALATASSSRHASCSAMFLEQQQQQQLQQSSLPQLPPAAGFGDGELSHRRLLPLTAANPLGGSSKRRHDGGGGFLLPGPGQRRGAAVDDMDGFLDDWGAGPAGCWGAPLMPPALCAPPLLRNDDGGNDGGIDGGADGGSGSSHMSSHLHTAWSTGVLLRQQGSSAPAHVVSSSLQPHAHGSPAPPVAATALLVRQQHDYWQQQRLIAGSPATVAAAAGGDAARSGHGSGLGGSSVIQAATSAPTAAGSSAKDGPMLLGRLQQQQFEQQLHQQLQQLQRETLSESLLHRSRLPDGGDGVAPAAGGGARLGPSREPARWPPVAVERICPPCQQLPAGFTSPLTPPLDTMDRVLTSLEQIKLQQFQQQERRQQPQQLAAGWSGRPQAQQQCVPWLLQQPQPLGHQAHTAAAPPLRFQLEMEMESLAGQGPLLSTPGGDNTTSHSALVVAPLPHDFAATCLLGQRGMGSATDDAGGACWVRGSSSRVPLDRSGKATYEPSAGAAAALSAAVAAVPPAAAGGAAPRGIERQLDRPAPLGPQQQQAAQQEGADVCCGGGRRGGHLELRGIGASGTYACGVEDHVMPPLELQQQQWHLQQQLPRPINPTDVEKREPPADGCEGAAVARRAEERLQLLNSGGGLRVLHGSTSSGRVPSEYLEPAAAAEKQGDGDSRALPTKARDAATSAVDGGLPRKKRPGAGDKAAQLLLARAKAQAAAVDWPLPVPAEAKRSGRSTGAPRVKEEDEDEEWRGDEGPIAAVALGEHSLQQEPTLEQLKRYYEQPIKAAARALGISLTCFKGVCRRLGVPRWPGRKLQTLKKMRDTLLQAGAGGAITIECAGGAVITPAEQTALIAKIALNISDIYADACTPMYPEFTRVRQLQYKTRSVARQGRRGGGSGGGGAGRKGAEGSESSDGEGTVTRRTTGGAGVGKGGGGVVKRRRRFSERYSVSSDEEASEASEEPDVGEVPQED